jgi:hypothetical protein
MKFSQSPAGFPSWNGTRTTVSPVGSERFHDPLRSTKALLRLSAGHCPASSHTRSSADGWGGLCNRHVGRDDDVLHRLVDLHQLCRTGLRMCFQLPVLGPAVGLVMVIDVAPSQACVGLVHDQTHVAADTH